MIFKSYIIEKNLNTINNCKLFLFYGENDGLKKDLKGRIKKENINSEILNLYQDEVLANSDLLLNEVLNKSLFENKKIIFVNEATDKVFPLIEELINNIDNEKIFFFSNILEKRSKLRNFFEKDNNCGICACYQDNALTLRKIIEEELKTFQGLTSSITNLIIENTGLDRNKLNNEITKIKSFFNNEKLNIQKVDDLLNVKTNEDFDQLKDEALKGNRVKTNKLLAETIFETEKNFLYLNSINLRINRLKEICERTENGEKIEDIITKMKPPVFWKDKPMLIEQSKKWNKSRINTMLEKTYDVELKIKSNPNINKEILFKNLIVELCSVANSS